MHPVCHRSFGFGLVKLGDAHTLIPRGTRLPVRRQVTLPVDKFYRPPNGHGRIVRVPIRQGQGARAVSLGTLEIVSPLKHPKSCRVIFRLTTDGQLWVSGTIGRRTKSFRIYVQPGPSRHRRERPWTQIGPLGPVIEPFPPPRPTPTEE